MYPHLVIFGIDFHAYTLFACAAAALALVIAVPKLLHRGFAPGQALALPLVMCISFLVMARLWNLVVNPMGYTGSVRWYTVKLVGLSFYGGLLGAGMALAALAAIWKKPILSALDAMTVPGGAAFCAARIGCFLNGCCGGKRTDSIFGMVFPTGAEGQQQLHSLLPFIPASYAVHPTQLYELFGAALGLLVLPWLQKAVFRKGKPKDGTFFLLYAAWLSAVRLAVLPMRALVYTDAVKKTAYPMLYAGVIFVSAALGLLMNIRRETKLTPERNE